MLHGDKSSQIDRQNQQAEPIEAGQDENDVGTKSAEARIWAAANKLTRNPKEPLGENQELY